MKEYLLQLLQEQWMYHRERTGGLVLGTLFGVCVLLFGFWNIVFVILCAGIGMYIGLQSEHRRWSEIIDLSGLRNLFRRMS